MYDVKNHQVDNLTYKILDVDEMLTIHVYNKRDKAKKYEVDAFISKRKPLLKKQFTRLVQLINKKQQTNNNNKKRKTTEIK